MPEIAAAPTVTWRAGNDKVAHAHLPRALRTVCGMEIVLERLAWPAFRKCMACRAALEQIPESELHVLDGNR
jgi:hypothetical protein